MMQWWADYLDQLRGPGEPSGGARKPLREANILPFTKPERAMRAAGSIRPAPKIASQQIGRPTEAEAESEDAGEEKVAFAFWVD
jgi:hypothetical protein